MRLDEWQTDFDREHRENPFVAAIVFFVLIAALLADVVLIWAAMQ